MVFSFLYCTLKRARVQGRLHRKIPPTGNWREKKDFYQREGQKRDELLGRLNDVEKQLFEEYMEMVLEGNNEKEMAIYQNGFLDGLYVANKIQNLDKIERRK